MPGSATLADGHAKSYVLGVSTLAETESAVDKLPPPQQEELFAFLAARLGRGEPTLDDPVADVIGAFAGKPGSTGRQVEDVLYGPVLGEAAA